MRFGTACRLTGFLDRRRESSEYPFGTIKRMSVLTVGKLLAQPVDRDCPELPRETDARYPDSQSTMDDEAMTTNDKTLRLIFPQWQGGNNPPYYFGSKLLAWLAPDPTGPVEEVPVTSPTDASLPVEEGVVARSVLVE